MEVLDLLGAAVASKRDIDRRVEYRTALQYFGRDLLDRSWRRVTGEPWRFVAVGYNFVPNSASLYELEDVRGYEAMTFRPLFDTFPLWCEHQPVWFNRVDDPSRPFLAFLNVRWALVANGSEAVLPGWTLLHHDGGGLLYENPRALPRALPRNHRQYLQ